MNHDIFGGTQWELTIELSDGRKSFKAGGSNAYLYHFDSLKMVENNTIYITTYDTLMNHGSEFKRIKFDAVVLEESQFVKNFRTQCDRAIQ